MYSHFPVSSDNNDSCTIIVSQSCAQVYLPDDVTLPSSAGVVTVKKPLDYETSKTAKFMVTASDNGHPQLTSTATINVAVVNINDETPIFTKVNIF